MSQFTKDFEAFIREQGFNVFGFAEICDGKSEYVAIKPGNPCQDSYSVAKAFVVTAVGLLYDRKMLELNERFVDIFPEELPEKMDPRWGKATIHDALTHRLGLPSGFLDIDVYSVYDYGPYLLKACFKEPLQAEPGGAYCYTDAAFYLLARVVEKKTGEALDTFLWRELFYKLRVREAAWSRCPQGHVIGATGLYIRTEDMAKLGQLYLQDGCWNGKWILSKEWCDLVRERGYELKPVAEGSSVYGKGGMCGQHLLILPDTNRVVAWHAFDNSSNKPMTEFVASY